MTACAGQLRPVDCFLARMNTKAESRIDPDLKVLSGKETSHPPCLCLRGVFRGIWHSRLNFPPGLWRVPNCRR